MRGQQTGENNLHESAWLNLRPADFISDNQDELDLVSIGVDQIDIEAARQREAEQNWESGVRGDLENFSDVELHDTIYEIGDRIRDLEKILEFTNDEMQRRGIGGSMARRALYLAAGQDRLF